MKRLIQRFRRDRRGVSAVEFAFIAPAMIFLYFGLAELSGALIADRNVNLVASEIGDLVTQGTSDSASTDIPNMIAAGTTVMAPLPTPPLTVKLVEVYADASGATWVKWCQPVTACAGYPTTDQGSPTTGGTSITLPSTQGVLVSPGNCIVQSQATYTYTSPVSYFIKTPWTFTQTLYLTPRQSPCVTLTS